MEIRDLILYKKKDEFIKDFKNARFILRRKYTYPVLQFMKKDGESSFYLSSSICSPVEMTYVEKTMTSIFNPYISYLETAAEREGANIPDGWRFIFMCSDNSSMLLKQVVTGKTVIQDNDSLKFWAGVFGTDYNGSVFDSKDSAESGDINKIIADILYDSDTSKKSKLLEALGLQPDENDYYLVIKDKNEISVVISDGASNITKKLVSDMNSDTIYVIFKDFIKFCESEDIKTYLEDVEDKNPVSVTIDLIADMFAKFCKGRYWTGILEANTLSKFDINLVNIHNKETAEFLNEHKPLRTLLKYILKVLCTSYYIIKPNGIYSEDFVAEVSSFKEKLDNTVKDHILNQERLTVKI
jgi:hypothetical protein